MAQISFSAERIEELLTLAKTAVQPEAIDNLKEEFEHEIGDISTVLEAVTGE